MAACSLIVMIISLHVNYFLILKKGIATRQTEAFYRLIVLARDSGRLASWCPSLRSRSPSAQGHQVTFA